MSFPKDFFALLPCIILFPLKVLLYGIVGCCPIKKKNGIVGCILYLILLKQKYIDKIVINVTSTK